MKNKKVIVIVGLARGGTNITWNMVQSHPQVVGAIHELTATITKTNNTHIRNLAALAFGHPFMRLPIAHQLAGNWLDDLFFREKLRALDDEYAKQKYDAVEYTRQEVEDSVLCLKAVNRDMYIVDLLHKIYDEVYIINIVRNGYAVCDSWLRRGNKAKHNGWLYNHYTRYMFSLQKRYPHVRFWKFEDVLNDLFKIAQEFFEFSELKPTELEKLRLKVKSVIKKDGTRSTTYKGRGSKHWFSRETIHELIVPNQSDIQASLLSDADRNDFEYYAKAVLEKLGYN